MTTEFKTYWIVDGVRYNKFDIVKKLIKQDKTAIEVSTTQQQLEAEKRKMIARSNAKLDEKIRKEAEARLHAQSPEGRAEAARRTARENPGGIVSGGENRLAELEAFGPDKTNLLR